MDTSADLKSVLQLTMAQQMSRLAYAQARFVAKSVMKRNHVPLDGMTEEQVARLTSGLIYAKHLVVTGRLQP